MSAFAETLEAKWKKEQIGVCTVRSFVGPSLSSGKGKLRGHLPKEYLSRGLTAVEILQCLFVDDGAFIFNSRADMTKGLTLLYRHFAWLGLEMHIGRGTAASKTECVFFPPPGFFDSRLPSLPAPPSHDEGMTNVLDYNNDALTEEERQAEQKERSRCKCKDYLYDKLDETQPIQVEDGYVTFCRHFKYLGSFISFCLCDDYDIEKKVTPATQSMGALKNVWDSPHLDIWSKYLLF
jgi:hypothetical protein